MAAIAVAAPQAAPAQVDDNVFLNKNQIYFTKASEVKLPAKAPDVHVEHSKQGQVRPLTVIDAEADWTAASLKGREEEYTYRFTDADVNELVKAVDSLKRKGVATEEDVKKLKPEDFDLPDLTPKLKQIGKEVSLGRGFKVLSGVPVEKFKGDRLGLVLAFWALGRVLGRPLVSQTDYTEDKQTFGSLLNHVTVGRFTHVRPNADEEKTKQRTNLTRLAFHSDQGATDLIALLSLTNAKSGGESKWVSGLAIHNELLRRGRKDLVETLADPAIWNTPRKKDQSSYERNENGSFVGWERTPPFEYHGGYLHVHFASGNYLENKDLTPLQEEAIWTFAGLAEDPEFHFKYLLKPGEALIVHNPTILHGRDEVEDGETLDQKRHLLRWWIAQPEDQNPRPVGPSFAPRSLVPPEGGFRVPKDSNVRLPFFPYSRHDGEGQSSY